MVKIVLDSQATEAFEVLLVDEALQEGLELRRAESRGGGAN